jgi:hypothetical protein
MTNVVTQTDIGNSLAISSNKLIVADAIITSSIQFNTTPAIAGLVYQNLTGSNITLTNGDVIFVGSNYLYNGTNFVNITSLLTVINTIQPTPTATGNTTNLNSVFKDSNNDTWIVDKLGNAIKAGSTVKKTTKRVTQALVAGNNVITHNLDLVAPFFVEISVRNATTGALITATKVPNSETTNTVAVESLSENASAEINIIAI